MLDKQNYSKAIQIAEIVNKKKNNYLIISDNANDAMLLENELTLITNKYDINIFPDREILPYDKFSTNISLIKKRNFLLNRAYAKNNHLVIVSVQNIFEFIQPKQFFLSNQIYTNKTEVKFHDFILVLQTLGFNKVKKVTQLNEYAVRGGIVDFYISRYEYPIRVEFFDNNIEEIRFFNPDTQSSIRTINKFYMSHAGDVPFDQESVNLFVSRWREYFDKYDERKCHIFNELKNQILSDGYENYIHLFFNKNEMSNVIDHLNKFKIIYFKSTKDKIFNHYDYLQERFDDESGDICRPISEIKDCYFHPKELTKKLSRGLMINDDYAELPFKNFNKLKSLEKEIIKQYKKNQLNSLIFATSSSDERENILNKYDDVIPIEKIERQTQGMFLLSNKSIRSYFDAINNQCLINYENISSHSYLIPTNTSINHDVKSSILDEFNLKVGDYVTHEEHGVGEYAGLFLISNLKGSEECFEIHYANNEKLYVPVRHQYLINKFNCANSKEIKLDSLSSQKWKNKKVRIKQNIDDLSAQLLDIESKRSTATTAPLKATSELTNNFANDFPYILTVDQKQCLNEITKDLSLIKPMNRVICGDVGFGKTEIAMRAIFLSAISNKQSILLCPSTVLARQHYETLNSRFKNFPINIDILYRHTTTKKKTEIINQFNEYKIDVLIGTHAILNSDIKYDNLGLLVIDEEHRFGTKQKELIKLKQPRSHTLYMSATPIPKTLNYIFSGLKDFSYVYSPPPNRINIKSFLHPYDRSLIKAAIERELNRKGQVFIVQNNINKFYEIEDLLKDLIPKIKVGIAHGRLPKKDISKTMELFVHGEIEVLICTTIVEMGLDIPNANTMIIMDSHNFGLSQLHQLRGRVGRSFKQAYCYFLIPNWEIKRNSKLRLDALMKYSNLGDGYFIAQEDLEIRGAGEFLGEKQSGHIETIGLSLYLSMLQESIQQLKGNVTKDINVDIQLGHPAYIPEDLMPSVSERLKFYRRLNNAKRIRDIDIIKNELKDRCGKLPSAINNLLNDNKLIIKSRKLSIHKIYTNKNQINIRFDADVKKEIYNKIISMIENPHMNLTIMKNNVIKIDYSNKDMIKELTKFINAIS